MEEITNAPASDRLRALRALRGLTQAAAAQRVGTTRQRFAGLEKGSETPARTLALAIEAEYGIPADAWEGGANGG